ncbi:MAG: choice-of-anchor L domain-containing protein, partial [Bacteroidota bacterium]
MGNYKKHVLFLFFLSSALTSFGQASINYTNPVNAINTLTSTNFNALNPTYSGGVQQLGIVDASATNLGFNQGIILATGDCQMAANSPGNSDDSSSEGFLLSGSDPDLELISGTTVFDAAVLEFDFVANSTSASLTFVFASEEYNEYVCGAVNDAFGIFLSGPGISGPFSNNSVNIANVPNTDTPVSINTVNNGLVGQAGILSDCENNYPDWNQHSNYFVDNSTLSTNPSIIEYDGFTLPISANLNLICGETYHLKIAIGDGGDPVYDSAVFLLAEGFVSNQVELIVEESMQVCNGESVQLLALTNGAVNWYPSIGIDNPGINNPIASPVDDTWYYVNSSACGSNYTDSIFVDVTDAIEIVNFISICEGESYIEGNSTYSQFGMYEDVYSSSSGCDSIVTTLLSVNPIVETTEIVSICQGEVYVQGNSVYTQAGIYSNTFQSLTTGCDSVVTTILNILPTSSLEIEAEVCFGEAFLHGGISYNQSGYYPHTFTGSNGCDSIVNLSLTVLPEIAISLSAIICEGETYMHGNQSYTQSGAYAQYLSTVNGCDSTVYISLFVNPIVEITHEIEICNGSSYQEGTSIYTSEGVYDDIYQSQTGCDSIVTTILTLTDFITHTNFVTICEGENYQEGQNIYSIEGSYEDWYQTNSGCDSLVLTHLSIVEPSQIPIDMTICEGESYTIGSQSYTESGTYLNTFQSSIGCDSLVILNLTVSEIFELTMNIELCEGESYSVGSNVYTQSGIYQNILQSTLGCDSIVISQVNFIPEFNQLLEYTLCAGDSIEINGSFYHETTVITEQLQNQYGCDSVLTHSINYVESELPFLEGSFCEGQSYMLDLSHLNNPEVEGYSYSSEGFFSFEQAGLFSYSITEGNCPSVGALQLEQIPLLESTSQNIEVCAGEQLSLVATYPEIPFTWNTGSNDSLLFVQNGFYYIDYDYLCGDLREEFTLQEKPCNCDLFIPNAFTPDADGINETWSPIANCELAFYELSIYDRWGELIFTVDDIE